MGQGAANQSNQQILLICDLTCGAPPISATSMYDNSDYPRIHGLGAIARDYSCILCDVWGVLHNGARSFEQSVDALIRFREDTGGAVSLITNAPRPHEPIELQLASLNVPESAFDAVVTSGDVTLSLIKKAILDDEKIWFIGPERDESIFDGLDPTLCDADEASVMVCTGLFDDTKEEPADYVPTLERMLERNVPMICANPDIVVDRDGQHIFCAGAIAEAYRALGGRVDLAGKPYGPIYDAAFERLEAATGIRFSVDRTLCIGDGINTDIRGANNEGIDALFITSGIHEMEFGAAGAPEQDSVAGRLMSEGLEIAGFMPDLRW